MSERYTLREAAKKLGLHFMTLYRWEREGKVVGPKRLKRNRERLFTDEDIARYEKFRDELIDPNEVRNSGGGKELRS